MIKNKTEEQLKAAIIQIHEALSTVCELKNDTEYIPSKQELELFEQLVWTFSMGYEKSQHISTSLERRSCGEVELPAKAGKAGMFNWRNTLRIKKL